MLSMRPSNPFSPDAPPTDDTRSYAGGKLIAKPRFTADDLCSWEKTLRCCLYATIVALQPHSRNDELGTRAGCHGMFGTGLQGQWSGGCDP